MNYALKDIIDYLDTTLAIEDFDDYGTNGLQIEASSEVTRIVTGVSANMALFKKAKQYNADLIVVHHGLFWKHGYDRLVGINAKRIQFLFEHCISLAGYHLPLDKHPSLGNNVGLFNALSLQEPHGTFGKVCGHVLGVYGTWDSPLSQQEAMAKIKITIPENQSLPYVFPYGNDSIQRVGLCTGSAGDLLKDAAKADCDLFITGEISEPCVELAREYGMTLVAAGHYNTEVYGAKALVKALSEKFSQAEIIFIDNPCPV